MGRDILDLVISLITAVVAATVIPHLDDNWFYIGLIVTSGCGWQVGSNLKKVIK